MYKENRKKGGRKGKKEGRKEGRKGGKKEGETETEKATREMTTGKMNSRASQLLGDQTHLGSSPWFLGLPKTKPSKSLLLPAPEPLDGTRVLRRREPGFFGIAHPSGCLNELLADST